MILPGTIILISILLMLAYGLLIKKYMDGFRLSRQQLPPSRVDAPAPSVSVIIPARNESANIAACLQSLLTQTYTGKIEIIVVDDASDDNTIAIAQQFPVTIIPSNPPPGTVAFKKQAITTGITKASGEVILTTDADCTVNPAWVHTMAGALQQQKACMVTGPVKMTPDGGWLSKFQSLDFAILQGITAASVGTGMHDMSSGANLAYLRRFFHEVGGFDGIDDIASGDDMLLMQKFSAQFPGRIGYAFDADAIVHTRTEPTWTLFLRQRIRWASKATRYRDPVLFRILLLVYLVNCWILAICIIGIWNRWCLWTGLAMVMGKLMVEWRFVQSVLHFFSLDTLMRWFPLAQPVHILYTVVSGFFGQAGRYAWKGRKVK